MVCSGHGTCDKTGACLCRDSWSGAACAIQLSTPSTTSASVSAAETVSRASAASALSASVSPSSATPASGPAAVGARPSPPPMVVLSRSGEHTASRVLEGKVAAPRKDQSGVSETSQATDNGDSNLATDPKPQARPDVATFIPVGREEETGRGSSPTPVRKGSKRDQEEARSGNGDKDAVQVAEKELFAPEKKVAGARTGTTRVTRVTRQEQSQEQSSSETEENEGRARTGKREVRGRVDETEGMGASTRSVGERASRLGGEAEQGDVDAGDDGAQDGAHVKEESRGTARNSRRRGNSRRRAPGAPTSGQGENGRPPSFEGGNEGVVDSRVDDGDAGGQDKDVDLEVAESPLQRPARGRRGHRSSRSGAQSADEDEEIEKMQSDSEMEDRRAGGRRSGQPSRPASVMTANDEEDADTERKDSRHNSIRPDGRMYGEQRSAQKARDVAGGGKGPRGEKRRESTGRTRQAPMPLDNRGRETPDLSDAQAREIVKDRGSAEGDEDSQQDAQMDAAGRARGSRSSGTRIEASPLGRKDFSGAGGQIQVNLLVAKFM
jgi:hypothetical protein